jgi:hypothetical protein
MKQMMMSNILMRTVNRIFILTACFAVSAGVVNGQGEYIVPLQSNPYLKARYEMAQKTFYDRQSSLPSVSDTLVLPFFDDFSLFTVWPDQTRWTDSLAFINFNFPINPPTVGVATFDGLDQTGNPFNNSSPSASGLCDELTSMHLDLNKDDNGLPYVPSDSIFLVFQYQRKGLGDAPDANDSLVLQFYSPVSSVWESVWAVTGGSADTLFNKVKISINEPDYRQRGFRFRFRNYGSQTGNADIFNVDYVSLRKFLPPDYENIRDFAYVYQAKSLLKTYSSVPWKHYAQQSQSQQQSMMDTSSDLTVRNNNESNPFPIKVAGNIIDQYGSSTPIVGGGGLNSIQVPLNENKGAPAPLLNNYYFQDMTTGDRATFTSVYEIGQTSGGIVDDYPQNDTLRHFQELYNYYAYDDGSAEVAYGVSGIGAQLAYKFELLSDDTLRAVQMFFTQIGANVSNSVFRIAIWTGGNSPSGSPIYEKFNQSPNYSDSINGFYTYKTDPLFLTAGTYYFGWIQNLSTVLNLGLDLNTEVDPSRKFFNVTGNWQNSAIDGAWMIRPVFSSTPIDVGINDVKDDSAVTLYPNPANDIVNIDINQKLRAEMTMEIIDVTGRVVVDRMPLGSSFSVRELSDGLYFVRFRRSGSDNHFTKRMIVSHP